MKSKKIKALGLIFLLVAWGADYFLLSKFKEGLKKIEFAVVNSGINANSSKLNFLKYISQERNESKLLSLSYRDQLEGIVATTLILQKAGIPPDKLDSEILSEANNLLKDVNIAYLNGTSLEPKDIKRNIRHEIVVLENKVNRYLVKCLQKSKTKYKGWDIVFIFMYALGSILLIVGEVRSDDFKK